MEIILSLDIASRKTGWAIIKNGKVNKKNMGFFVIDTKISMGERLLHFEENVKILIDEYKPDIVSIEDIFKGRNANTFKILSLFRGIAIKSIFEKTGKDPISIMAAQVRKLIELPNDKETVFNELNKRYKLDFNFKNDNDVVDAIALGLATYNIKKQGIDERSLQNVRRRKRRKRKRN